MFRENLGESVKIMKSASFLYFPYFYLYSASAETDVENGRMDLYFFVVSISNSSSFLIPDFPVSSPTPRLLVRRVFSLFAAWCIFMLAVHRPRRHCVPARACLFWVSVQLLCLYFNLSCRGGSCRRCCAVNRVN